MITLKNTIQDALELDYSLSSIFSRFKINAKEVDQTLSDLLIDKGINREFFVELLNQFSGYNEDSLNHFDQYSITTLVDYLERSHQFYIETKLPEIEQTLMVLNRNFAGEFPVLNVLSSSFYLYKYELIKHFKMEEKLLFPYSKLLDASLTDSKVLSAPCFEIQIDLIEQFKDQHEESHHDLDKIKDTIMACKPTGTDGSLFRIFVSKLTDFEKDLNFHSLLEDEILVPKLEKLQDHLNEFNH